MRILVSMSHYLSLLVMAIAAGQGYASNGSKPFSCAGGSIYFAAHPADTLLYQNPDIFHDLYVLKCTTTVLFTSGDGGIAGNYSRSVERGLEEAYSFMAAAPTNETAWNETDVQLNGKVVLIRSLKDYPNVQVVYLRLPHGRPDGQAYTANRGTLKKLYTRDVKSLSATDGSATYTLDSLKELIAAILKRRAARDIRVMDYKTQIPKDNEKDCDHADHSISARLVAEVMERERIPGTFRGYAGGTMRNLQQTLMQASLNLEVKTKAFFQFAKHDNATCKDLEQCSLDAEVSTAKSVPENDDTSYIADWLKRECYVQ